MQNFGTLGQPLLGYWKTVATRKERLIPKIVANLSLLRWLHALCLNQLIWAKPCRQRLEVYQVEDKQKVLYYRLKDSLLSLQLPLQSPDLLQSLLSIPVPLLLAMVALAADWALLCLEPAVAADQGMENALWLHQALMVVYPDLLCLLWRMENPAGGLAL